MRKCFSFLFFSAVLMMAACGNEESGQEADQGDLSAEETDEIEISAGDGEYHHVGDTIELEESIMINQPYTLTVNDFTITREFKGEPMEEYLIGFEEDTGFHLAIVNVEVTNNGDEAFKFEENSNLSLMESDREGFNYMEEYAIEEELTTDIEPGESLTIDLPFIVNVNNSEGNYYFYIDPAGSKFQEIYKLAEQ